MRIWVIVGMAAMVTALPPISCAGGAVPDLTGTWTGDFSIVRNAYSKKAGPNPLAFTKPGFHEARGVKYVIDAQKGRVFSGTESFADSEQKFVGVIQHDDKSFYIADKTGFLFGKVISADKMHLIYLETTEHGQAAAGGTITRQRRKR
ncbi:hypothetical protein ACFL2Q_10380 [Thermodesulfobacteriota bacterium]